MRRLAMTMSTLAGADAAASSVLVVCVDWVGKQRRNKQSLETIKQQLLEDPGNMTVERVLANFNQGM